MPNPQRNLRTGRWLRRSTLALVLGLLSIPRQTPGTAQEEPEAPREPVGRYLTLATSPVARAASIAGGLS